MTAMLINHLWQSTVFAGLAGLAALALRQHGAHVRYWVWFAASVKFLVPFSALAAVGRSFGWQQTATAGQAWAYRLAEPMTTVVADGDGGTAFGTVLLAIWLAGSALVVGLWLARWLRLQAAVSGTRTLQLAPLVGGSIEVRETAAVGPGVVGFLRPVLVVPKGIVEQVSPQHLRPVLQHEICHLRRQDNLTALIHMIVEAAFWFHPLVWLIGDRLIAERERACDEFVVSAGTEPEAYAESIIEVCRFHVDAALPCAAGIGSSKLKARIEAIVENRRLRQLSHNGFALLAAAAAAAMATPVLFGAFGMLPVAAQPAPQTQTQTQPQIQDQGADAQPDPSSETTQPSPAPDSAVRPISTVPPYYPPQALRQRIEGSVTVEFTITTTGSVRDPVVVSSNPPGVFDEAALQSISQWMYNPLLESGVAVERQGMRTRIDWVLSPTETDVP